MDAQLQQLLIDPITLDTFNTPVLASDGYTYSLQALRNAIETDVWQRSPITREVLRPLVFPNTLVANLLGIDTITTSVPVASECTVSSIETVPDDGRVQMWTLPTRLSIEDTVHRHALNLPPEPVLLQARMWRDAAGLDWLMHPPCTAQHKDAATVVAKLFGVNKVAVNPWCISTCVFIFKNGMKYTVEDFFIQQTHT
jgi:hypothetical protein